MALMQEGASSDTYMSVDVENSDNFRVEMIPTDAVKTVGYSLFDVYSENIMTGVRASVDNGLGIIYNETSDNKGFIFIGRMRGFVKSAYDQNNGGSLNWTNNSTLAMIKELNFRPSKLHNILLELLQQEKQNFGLCK